LLLDESARLFYTRRALSFTLRALHRPQPFFSIDAARCHSRLEDADQGEHPDTAHKANDP
jgi:hypothetical protein